MEIRKELMDRDRGREMVEAEIEGVYAGEGVQRILQSLGQWSEDGEEIRVLVGGEIEERKAEVGEEERKRRSKDEKINGEGRKLVEFIEGKGWSIFNGGIRGDEEGEYTFTGGKGNTVIDYVIGGEEVKDRIKRMRIGDKVDSDHHPLEVWIKGAVQRRRERRREGKRNSDRGRWDEEGRSRYRGKMEGEEIGEGDVGVVRKRM